jgi:hypothetical protein
VSIFALSLLAFAGAAPPPSDMSAHDTRLLIRGYGECVVKHQARRAEEAILANLRATDLVRKHPQLVEGTCVPNVQRGQTVKVRFQGDQYRYALADALVKAQLAKQPAPALEAVPNLSHRVPMEPSRVAPNGKPLSDRKYQEAVRDYEEREAFSVLSRYGECVVRANPAAARALLLTEPESAEEAAQFAAMQTALGTCVEEGQKISLGKLALRGTIAVNYYRLARAAMGGANVRAAK